MKPPYSRMQGLFLFCCFIIFNIFYYIRFYHIFIIHLITFCSDCLTSKHTAYQRCAIPTEQLSRAIHFISNKLSWRGRKPKRQSRGSIFETIHHLDLDWGNNWIHDCNSSHSAHSARTASIGTILLTELSFNCYGRWLAKEKISLLTFVFLPVE